MYVCFTCFLGRSRGSSQIRQHGDRDEDVSASSNEGAEVKEWEVFNNLGLVRWKAGRLTEFVSPPS